MDTRIDEALSKIQRKGLETILFLWTTLNSTYEWCKKSWKGAMDIHKQDILVFMDNNQYPICVKEEDYNTQHLKVYNPDENIFIGHHRSRRFDVLSVSYTLGNEVFDLTNYFISIRWRSTVAPSLLEIILLHHLNTKLYTPVSAVKKGELTIQDSEMENHIIPLTSQKANLPFEEWN